MTSPQTAQAELDLFKTPIVLPTNRVRDILDLPPHIQASDEDKVKAVAVMNDIKNSMTRTFGVPLLTFVGNGANVAIKMVLFADTIKLFVTFDDFVSPVVGLQPSGLDLPDRGLGSIKNAITSLLLAKGFGAPQFDHYEKVINCIPSVLSDDDVCQILKMCFRDGVSKRFSGAEHFMAECYELGQEDCDEYADFDDDTDFDDDAAEE